MVAGGELAAGALEVAGGDVVQGEGALAARPGEEQGVELEAAGSAEGESGAVVADGELVGEGEAEQIDEVLGEGGEVGEGAFFDLAVFPVGFAEEVAGGLAGVGGGDVRCMTKKRRRRNELNQLLLHHMNGNSVKQKLHICMTMICRFLGPNQGSNRTDCAGGAQAN